MKRTLALLLIVIAFSAPACKAERAGEAAPAPSSKPAAPARRARQAVPALSVYDDWASLASGLPAASPDLKTLESEAAWKEFAAAVGADWKTFDAAILEPMKAWAREDMRDSWPHASTLFYPFGGPDFVTADAIFPKSSKFILMGLEPVGNLPDLAMATPEWRALFYKDFGGILADFLKRGYFVTQHMNEAFAAGRVDGALPIIAFFLERAGCSILDMKRLAVDERGEWRETPYEALRKLPRRPYGVRIDYVKPGESGTDAVRTIYYFSCDLANASFAKASPLYRFFDALREVTTYIKSASYLLHYAEFSNIRDLILANSRTILEDDTGVPYRFFKGPEWSVQLYGAYAKPVEDFAGVEQMDLKAAYADPASKVKPLPFHFGYRWVSKIDNLLLIKRTN